MAAPPKFSSLVEGVDYYLEGLRVVFTETYHLKRGYCCNSKCRHCPYRGQRAPVMMLQDSPKLVIKPPTGG